MTEVFTKFPGQELVTSRPHVRRAALAPPPLGQGRVLFENAVVGSTNFDGAIGGSFDGIAALFVAVVFSAGNACVVGVG